MLFLTADNRLRQFPADHDQTSGLLSSTPERGIPEVWSWSEAFEKCGFGVIGVNKFFGARNFIRKIACTSSSTISQKLNRLRKHEGDSDTVSLSFQGIHWPFIASFTLFTLLGKRVLQAKCCICGSSCIFWRSKLSWKTWCGERCKTGKWFIVVSYCSIQVTDNVCSNYEGQISDNHPITAPCWG